MKAPKHLFAAAALAALTALSSASRAQSGDLADGEVRKVDVAAAKLTLKHGEIKNLDMPPMTMVFTVRDPASLQALKPGDKVKFKAVNEGGKLTVTEIQPAR